MKNHKIVEILENSFQKYQNKTAISYKGIAITYEQMKAEIHHIQECLRKIPLRLEKPVGLFFKNCPEFIIGYYGLIYAGITPMLVDHSLKQDELSLIVKDCHLGGFLIHKEEKQTFPLYQHFQVVLETKNYVLVYNDKIDYNKPFDSSCFHNVTSCRFSSGTTGVPKCMMYTQNNIIAAAFNWKKAIQLSGIDKVLCLANFTHGLAFNTSMLSPLSEGAEIHILNSLMPRTIGKYIEDNQITILVAFPVLYQMMSEENLKEMYHLETLRICVSSGTVLHTEIKKNFKQNVGISIADLYGIAETGLCILNTTDNIETVGKAIPNVEAAIMGDDGTKQEFGKQGQIAIKSPSMAIGYYNFPGMFEERITKDGFYLSGDIGTMDENGFVYIQGRKQDFIDISGKKVDPKEIEETLLKLRGIREVAVFGKNSVTSGQEVLCAAIVSENNLSKSDVTGHISEKMAAYKIPQEVYFVKKLPRNSAGKVLRTELSKYL